MVIDAIDTIESTIGASCSSAAAATAATSGSGRWLRLAGEAGGWLAGSGGGVWRDAVCLRARSM